MSRKGRGDKKVLEIARTETFGRGNLGSHCLQLMQLIWVAGFDGSCASFIREKFLAALFSAAHRQRGRVGALRSPRRHFDARCPYHHEITSPLSPVGGGDWQGARSSLA